MPVLSEQTSLFPEDLLDPSLSYAAGESWWVLYTKSRQEKAVVRHLLAHRVAFYLPLVKRTLFYHGRRLVSRVPLFPGYVFVCGTADARLAALTSNRVSRVLPVDDPVQLHGDLQRVRRLIASDAPLTPESRLVAGKWVRIRRGPMEGLEGVVLKRRGQTRLVVSINFIQQGASIEVEDHCLEPIEAPANAGRGPASGTGALQVGKGREARHFSTP